MGNCVKHKTPERQETYSKFINPKKRTETVTQSNFIKLNKDKKLLELYRVQEKLGSGAYGSVCKVVSRSTGIERACKSVKLSSTDDHAIAKLMEEVNILKILDHPNITRVYEVLQDSTHLHIVQELCTGGELFDKIAEEKGFSENRAAKYMLEITSAVMHCHELGIMHRDLKPENLIFQSRKEDAPLKVIDFGTSVHFRPNKKLKEMIGTSYYMAPEIIKGNYDQKCDVWSCGVIMYILLSGNAPFNGNSDREIIFRIQTREVSFVSEVWKGVSEEAKCLIRKMLNKNPKKRPSIFEVFNDKWIQSRSRNITRDVPLRGNYIENLYGFRASSKLQRATMSFIASQMLTSEESSELERIFRACDENGDGKLSPEEIEHALEKLGFPSDFDVGKIMEECDSDGNGFINYSEFLTAAANWNQILSKERLKEAFKEFDKNGDQKISLDELKETLGGENVSDKQILQMLKEADKDGDGEIDMDEFTQMMLQKIHTEDNRV